MRSEYVRCAGSNEDCDCYIDELINGGNIIKAIFPQKLWPEVRDGGFHQWDLFIKWRDRYDTECHQQSRSRLICLYHSEQIFENWSEDTAQNIAEDEALDRWIELNGGRL